MKITQLLFSPTGGTQKAADLLAHALSDSVQTVDLCDSQAHFSEVSLASDDLALIAVPSYGGRVPAAAIQRLAAVHGNGAPAILMVVYGNRAFEDTMVELEDAAGIAKRMVDVVLPDYPFVEGDEVAVLVSGLGATPVMELYVLYNEIEKLLTEKGIRIHRSYVGNYFTSMEMMGATLTVIKLDDELKELIDMPVDCMGMQQK